MVNHPGNLPDVYIVADNILSPIGDTTAQNLAALKAGVTGVKVYTDSPYTTSQLAVSIFEHENFIIDKNYTKFENLLISSISNSIAAININLANPRTGLVVSTTKGNIGLLASGVQHQGLHQRMALHTSAQLVADHFGFTSKPIVVSNACISGVMAILTGMRLIQSGQYDNVVVTGADVVSRFIVSGFQSFKALSDKVCKPFDKDRAGLNLGEGAATVILSSHRQNADDVKVSSGAISNDANHISGPSRTGHELGYAIKKALLGAGITAADVGYISAHGTATNYNDEMEANALNFAGLQLVPTNSLKGYYGHTLGAAGIIESVVGSQAIKQSLILPSLGYTQNGVSQPVNIVTSLINQPVKHILKTASGFGGCNAAMIFSR